MWVIMAVSIQLLSGPNVWAVADEGTFQDESECQAALSEAVPRTLSEGMRLAWEGGELKFICVKTRANGQVGN
ncbi:hypothetical protein [Roseibium sp. LAB1]